MENDFYVKNRGRRGLSSYTPFTSTHYAKNEHFMPSIPRSLLWTRACDGVLFHDRWRALGPRSNFSLPRVVGAIMLSPCPIPTKANRIAHLSLSTNGVARPRHATGDKQTLIRLFCGVFFDSMTFP